MYRKCRRLASKKVSKNSRRGQKENVLKCTCGGTIKMRTVFNGSMKRFAQCGGCEKTARKPSELMPSPSVRRSLGLA